MQYRKRRIAKAPNKNQEKRQRNQASSLRLLSSLFPSVERVGINLRFHSQRGHLLAEEARAFQAGDVCDFSAPCPGGCGDGRVDLIGKVASVVNAGDSGGEGRGRCEQPLYGQPEMCGCAVSCTIDVRYRPGHGPETGPSGNGLR